MVEEIPLSGRNALGTIPINGICTTVDRTDLAYGQITPGPNVTSSAPADVFSVYNTRLRPPFCIAFTIMAEVTNDRPFMFFYQGGGLNPIGNIAIDASGVSFTLNGQMVTFPGSFQGSFQQLQLCANGTHLSLWQDCGTLVGTQNFIVPAAGGVGDGDSFSLFLSIVENRTDVFEVSPLEMCLCTYVDLPSLTHRGSYNNCTLQSVLRSMRQC